MMVVHHMLTTSNLTIYLTFPELKAAHRVVDHTRSNEVACRPLTQLGHLAANCLRSREPGHRPYGEEDVAICGDY
jgi:hypothetical protein